MTTRFTAADYRTYEGFPEGVSDGFIRHAAVATSQYGTTARALAAELLIVRQQAAAQAEQLEQQKQNHIADNIRHGRTIARQAEQIAQIRAMVASSFLTCFSGDGVYEVRLRFPELKDAQRWHEYLIRAILNAADREVT